MTREFPDGFLATLRAEESGDLDWLSGLYQRWIDATSDPVLLHFLEDARDAIEHELASREPLPDGVVV